MPRSFVALLLVWGALCAVKLTLTTPEVWRNDASGYYAWAQSLVVDGDPDPTNQLRDDEDLPRVRVGEREVVVDKYQVGWSLAALPGMALGQAGCRLANHFLGATYALGGLDPPVVRLTWLCVFAWTLLGLAASFSFVRSVTGAEPAAWGCGLAWLGTSAFAYTWKEPMMAHALCLTFVAVSYEASRRWSVRPATGTALAAGLAVGMVLAVRCVNALLLLPLLPILWTARSRLRLAHLAVAFCGAAAPVLVQLVVWRQVYGVWFFDGYAASGEGFAFAPENVLRVAASSRRGLFFWHPITVVALAGLWALARGRGKTSGSVPRVAALGLAALGGLVLVYGSWSSWGLGWSHGARWSTDAYPLWALGLAHVLARRRDAGVPSSGLLLACVWSAALVSLQIVRILPMAGPVELGGWTLP